MSAPPDILRRVERLTADQADATRSAIVIYEVGESEEEKLARVPDGAEFVLMIPNNHRDDRPEAP